jgi:Electron transfer DM13
MALRRFVSRHRVAAALAIGLMIAGLAVVVFWFEPQQLFIDDKVDESLPGAAAVEEDEEDEDGSSPSDKEPGKEASPRELAMGTFRAINHEAAGKALLLEVDGARFLRFEDFEVENGPDLRVYLSSAPASGDDSAFAEDFVDLGGLKGNVGDQNYKLPDGVDLQKYRSAVVWCRRFSVGFAVADLST